MRVTPDDAYSQEARLELSGGVNSPKRARGGAPEGVRVPLDALPRPKRDRMATFVGVARLQRLCAFRRSASLLGEALEELAWE